SRSPQSGTRVRPGSGRGSPYAEEMATNLPDNAENGRSGEPRPDRYTGRARVSSQSYDPKPYDPQAYEQREPQPAARPYRSRSYRGMPYQRPADGTVPRRIRPRWGRIAVVAAVVAALLAGCGALVSWLWLRNIDADLKR